MGETVEGLRELRRLAEAAAERNRRKGEGLVGEIERRKARIRREFWEIGVALSRLAEPAIYASMGFGSFGELLDGRGLFARSHAHRLVEVARTFTREQALALGAEKAFALTRYVAATPEQDIAGSLVEADARIDGKRLSAISLRQLEAATKAVRGKGRKATRDPLERAARSAARGAQAALRKRGARGARASAVRADGVWVVRIEVPMEVLEVITGE